MERPLPSYGVASGIDDVLGPSPTFGVTLPPPPEDVTEVSDEEFYSNLLFLGTLTPFRGPQEPRETAVANENETAKEVDLRRDFLTQLAYLCDYMKGGDTVTATGVQADPQIPNWEEGEYILWMAANAGCDNFEQGYIREWLEDSFFPKGPDRAKYKSDAENLKEEILSKFVNLATCPDDCRCSKTEGLR
ncbi:hypothetical protein FQN50_004999 [Emmonsiellopsis sp. PD_5]|nr:hypothetical protein FQN50_004999 [Emmonsiellopsis sp. PD_5]